jgi:hypothetical protein
MDFLQSNIQSAFSEEFMDGRNDGSDQIEAQSAEWISELTLA